MSNVETTEVKAGEQVTTETEEVTSALARRTCIATAESLAGPALQEGIESMLSAVNVLEDHLGSHEPVYWGVLGGLFWQ